MTSLSVRRMAPAIAIAALGALVLILRFTALDAFPPPTSDEGGWPYAVRVWVTEGTATFDFHSAPGYHLMLGPAFALFGPTLDVARWTSAVFGLIGVVLLFLYARRATGDSRVAGIAMLLLATSFEAISLDRRALIEPIQIAWILAVLHASSIPTRRGAWLLAFTTMMLLLVKANAIILVAAIGLAALFERRTSPDALAAPADADWRARLSRPIALAAGACGALAVFGALFVWDRETFLVGWVDNVALPGRQVSGTLFRVGRFAVNPQQALESLDRLAAAEPFLLAFGLAGAIKAIHERRLLAPALIVVFTLPWLLLQIWQPQNYYGVLLAPLALLTASLLTAMPGRWTTTVFTGIVGFNVLRLAGGLAMVTPPERAAVKWLEARRAPEETVLSASYVLMQIAPRTVTIPTLGADYLPTPERLKAHGVDWVLYDPDEWGGWLRRKRFPPDTATAMLDRCCTRMYADDRGYLIYRTSPPPQ